VCVYVYVYVYVYMCTYMCAITYIYIPSKRVISSPFLHFSIFFSKILLGNPKFFAVGN